MRPLTSILVVSILLVELWLPRFALGGETLRNPRPSTRQDPIAELIGSQTSSQAVSPDRSADAYMPNSKKDRTIPLDPIEAVQRPLTINIYCGDSNSNSKSDPMVTPMANGQNISRDRRPVVLPCAHPRMIVRAGPQLLLNVKVQFGKVGHETVEGCYQPFGWDKHHTSGSYKGPDGKPAPMPNAIAFYDDGEYIHEGNADSESHGCIHLDHASSAKVYDWVVHQYGIENTSICIN